MPDIHPIAINRENPRPIPFFGDGFSLQGVIRLACLLTLLSGLSACSSWKVEDAFEGEFTSIENNRIINDYCQSCHIHSTFASADHLDKVAQKYNRKVFRYATECRTCHFIEISWMTDEVKRKTRSPEEANKGEFRSFELDALKDQRDRRQELLEQDKQDKVKKPKASDKEESSFLGIF